MAAVVIAAALLASCSSGPGATSTPTSTPGATGPVPKQYPARVALFGDSLSYQAEPYFVRLMAAADTTNTTYYSSQGGTAICDWLARMRTLRATMHFDAVILEFSGNALTSCMAGIRVDSPAFYAKYRADTLAAVALWVSAGAHVFLVGSPVTRAQQAADPDWDALNLQYEQIAAGDAAHVTYVDAGAVVEGPGGRFTQTLPCLYGEPCTGPVVGGVPSNVVRSADGVHFCPVTANHDVCPVYSSGAFRFADAMVHGLVSPAAPESGSLQGVAG